MLMVGQVLLGIGPDEPQGKVIDVARGRAREHLRQGRPFVWDATNLSRQLRRSVVTLCYDYGARVRIVHAEAPEPVSGWRPSDETDLPDWQDVPELWARDYPGIDYDAAA